MTRKKFVEALLDAIITFAGMGDELELKTPDKFKDARIGIFFGHIEGDDHTIDIQHYMLLELNDGSKWRIVPERVLKLEPHEQKLWDRLKEYEGEIPPDDDETPDEELDYE